MHADTHTPSIETYIHQTIYIRMYMHTYTRLYTYSCTYMHTQTIQIVPHSAPNGENSNTQSIQNDQDVAQVLQTADISGTTSGYTCARYPAQAVVEQMKAVAKRYIISDEAVKR